jgi:histone H3/H4
MARKRVKKSTTKKKQKDVLVVASKVKAYMHSKSMNTSAETIEHLSRQVYALLDAAVERTRANGRKTVKPQDI